MAHIEFEKLEQRPGTHVVPVKMTREELELLAEKMATVNTQIDAKESDLREYSKEVREDIKLLEQQRHAITATYRFKRDPKSVDGLWGFDFQDNGKVGCRTCIERKEKHPEQAAGVLEKFDNADDLLKAHDEHPWEDGMKHPSLTVWERPHGTKWFVDPNSGDVYGPMAATEKDLQRNLLPETKEFQPFQLSFDPENAVPILDPKQVSAAEKKIKETEAELEMTAIAEDVHEDCGLPQTWHVPPRADADCASCGTIEGTRQQLPRDEWATVWCSVHDDRLDLSKIDYCKQAMKRGANEANKEQAARTEATYGKDNILDPDSTFPCGSCGVESFGRDLQAVTIDGAEKFVCFACEQNVAKDDQAKPKKKAPKTKKKKDAGDQPVV